MRIIMSPTNRAVKDTSLFLAFFLLALFSPHVPAAQSGEVHQDFARICAKGKLTVAMHSVDVKPFFVHKKNGELIGFDVDIAKDIAQRIGVELELNREARTFDEVVELVADRKADIAVSMLSDTLKRAMKVRFTEPYITLYRALVVNRLELAKKKKLMSDLFLTLNVKGIKIGVIDGSSYIGFAKEDFPKATIVPYKDWDSVMQAVLIGEIFAGQYDNNEAANWSFDHPESALYIKTVLLKGKKDTLSFATHNEDEYLLYWLNLYIKKMQNDGTYEMLMKKYFSDERINIE